jgi:hypothetical protein
MGTGLGPPVKLMKLAAIGALLFSTINLCPSQAQTKDDSATDNSYKSPYSLNYTIPLDKLLAPDSDPPRNDWHLQSETAYERWYSPAILKRFGSWGPEPRHFPAPFADFTKVSPDWMRQRLLAVGQKMIGLPYQHHHIPAWDPPADWPWKEVAYGRQSQGVDCSDFTSWLYNYGLGIKLITNVHKQADRLDVPAPGGEGTITAQEILGNGDYKALIKNLITGDLLYIKNKQGEISHVIMWVGNIGKSPDGEPLVMDCTGTGTGHKDSNGTAIPLGVQLRPFTEDSWYFKSFSHAHRIIGL